MLLNIVFMLDTEPFQNVLKTKNKKKKDLIYRHLLLYDIKVIITLLVFKLFFMNI